MKKLVVVIVCFSVAVLSFMAGGHYSKDKSAEQGPQREPNSSGINHEPDNSDTQLSPGAVIIKPARLQLIGVKAAPVENKSMTYTLRLYGRVVGDETKAYRVNASTDCWIRALSDVATGSIVRKNQILAEALAPAYYNAQVTYLVALNNIDRIRQQLGGETRHQQVELADNQIRMAVQALQNLGITNAQTEELAKTRQARPYLQVRAPTSGVVLSRKLTLNQWFKAGDEFYTIADIGRVWVYADVYEDEALHMRPGMAVEVRHEQMGKTFAAKVAQALPLFDSSTRTLKVRIDVDNPRYDLRPDMFVDVEIPIALPPSLNVPAEAVIDTGKRAIVYVDKGNGVFEPRRVKTGWNLGGRIEITDGLLAGEKIVFSGNFLIDSESRMGLAAFGMEAGIDEDASPDGATRQTGAEKKRLGSAMPPGGRSWAELLDFPGGGGTAGGAAGKAKPKAKGKYPTTPEIVDWGGGEKKGAPPRDWSGWGKFPGADYLGIKREANGSASQPSKPSKPEPEKPAQKQSDPGDNENQPQTDAD